jgi:hypothetical protein
VLGAVGRKRVRASRSIVVKKEAGKSKGAQVAAVWVSVALASVSASGWAQNLTDAEAYGTFYGDGLRHYVEGRYDRAVEQLFRAYALRPTAAVAGLLVRSYDFMGHCDAAGRQLEFYGQAHPREPAIRLQRCERPAELVIECEGRATTTVRVGPMIETQCGATLRVAPGRYAVEVEGGSSGGQMIEVAPGEQVEVALEGPGRGLRRTIGESRVPRLKAPGEDYRVIRSSDGLYEIWVRAQMGRDPDMFPLDTLRLRPYVEMICADEGADEAGMRACYFLQRKDDSHRYYVDDPGRHEGRVPRIP